MRLLLLVLTLFAVGAASAYYLRSENGYVLLSYGQWMVETSIVGFIAALLVTVVLLMALLRSLSAGMRLPQTVREAMAGRRARKEHTALVRGIKYWLAGRDERAEVTLQKSMPDNEDVAARFLLAALAARRQKQPERVQHYLERAALLDEPLTNEAIALLQADAALEGGDVTRARELLEALRERVPSHPRVYPALAETLVAARDWQAALELLRETEKTRGWAQGQWQRLTVEALQGALGEALRIEDAKRIWSAVSKAIQQRPQSETVYAAALHRLNAENDCMSVIHRALERGWNPEMVQLFLRVEPSDNVAALASVEQWLQRHGEQPELLLAAAHTCRRNRLWGKARSYIDVLVQKAPSADAYYEYGLLCRAIQQDDEAVGHFQKGLELALR